MALGDLVDLPFVIEFNDLAIGPNKNYHIFDINKLLGYDNRSDSVDKFGQHGGVGGRHYSSLKRVNLLGEIRSGNDTEFEARRQALGLAYKPIIDVNGHLPLVTMFPGASGSKFKIYIRPLKLDLPVDRMFALGLAKFQLQLEVLNPRLLSLIDTTINFTATGDTQTITNNGNAESHWIGTLVGPCDNPIITNDLTGQKIQFDNVSIGATETLVYDSSKSTVKLNGNSISLLLDSGFSWWSLDPGNTDINFTATNASTATFSITYNDSYWII